MLPQPTESLVKPTYEVADVFRLHIGDYLKIRRIPTRTHKLIWDILHCRTALMGGHERTCSECRYKQNEYSSCQNRHCPKCQALKKAKWLSARKSELLPIGYFHNVFTLPHELNPLILGNKTILLNILFRSVKETLTEFALNSKRGMSGQLGFTAVLHTWDQLMNAHYHLHCIIPAGVLSLDRTKWIHTKKSVCKKTKIKKDYLFSIRALSKTFRGKYLDYLRQAFENGELIFSKNIRHLSATRNFEDFRLKLSQKNWVVYSKAPFKGPEYVFEYLGRYVHRVAISNDRIKDIGKGTVTISYKDRNDGYKSKEETIPGGLFMDRFLLHELPNGFMKIRHYGFLANRFKNVNLAVIRKLLKVAAPPCQPAKGVLDLMLELTGRDLGLCTQCGKGRMQLTGVIDKPSRSKPVMKFDTPVHDTDLSKSKGQFPKPFS